MATFEIEAAWKCGQDGVGLKFDCQIAATLEAESEVVAINEFADHFWVDKFWSIKVNGRDVALDEIEWYDGDMPHSPGECTTPGITSGSIPYLAETDFEEFGLTREQGEAILRGEYEDEDEDEPLPPGHAMLDLFHSIEDAQHGLGAILAKPEDDEGEEWKKA